MKVLWYKWRLQYLKALLLGAIDTKLRNKILDNIQRHCELLNKTTKA